MCKWKMLHWWAIGECKHAFMQVTVEIRHVCPALGKLPGQLLVLPSLSLPVVQIIALFRSWVLSFYRSNLAFDKGLDQVINADYTFSLKHIICCVISERWHWSNTQNYRMVEVRKDLWRSSGPTHVLEQGYLAQVVQAHVWMALEADYTTTLFCMSIPQTC